MTGLGRQFSSENENCETRDCDVIGRAFPFRCLSTKTELAITSSTRSSSRRRNVRLRAFD
jgi:hypothetical protein